MTGIPATTRGSGRRPGRARRILLRTALALIAMLAAVCILEGALRVLDIAPPDPPGYVGEYQDHESADYVVDEDLGWRMRPSHSFTWDQEGVAITCRSDADGFRTDPSATPAKATRTFALVGDSNTWGFGLPYDQSFGALLARDHDGTAVRNFAMPGFGVDQMWQCLRRYVLPTRPDLVIVGLVRDDFHRTLRAYRRSEGFNKPLFLIEDGALRRATAADRPGALREWLDEHSNAWTALRRGMERIGYRFGIGSWWTRNAAVLDAMRHDAAAAGVKLLFVHLPEPGEGRFPALADYMAAAGADYVEPADTPTATGEALFFHDRHLNAAGHRWIAHALEERLARVK